MRHAVTSGSTAVVDDTGRRVGALVAELHAALTDTGRSATAADMDAWLAGALIDLDRALEVTTEPARELLARRADVVRRLVLPPSGLAGTPLVLVHGDLHVGQVLRAGDADVVTDYDGNPVVPPASARRRKRPPSTSPGWRSRSATPPTYFDVMSPTTPSTWCAGCRLRSWRRS